MNEGTLLTALTITDLLTLDIKSSSGTEALFLVPGPAPVASSVDSRLTDRLVEGLGREGDALLRAFQSGH